ncbi:hypothetical protein BC332_26885 [Capsicum chinense]|nr:hypothetical protein BC332_26885 [Capsicum chinense]
MSPLVARGVVNLRILVISRCPSMEEVIMEEEQQVEEIMINEPLFPHLEELHLSYLPKLEHFFQMKRALEFPFLRRVELHDRPRLKTFIQDGSMTEACDTIGADVCEVEMYLMLVFMFLILVKLKPSPRSNRTASG